MHENITTLHTLGPSGTNCELAANEWFRRRGVKGSVFLYPTLEEACESIPNDDSHALMGCIVYPYLSELVFKNLSKLVLIDCLIMPTDDMVYARNNKVTDNLGIASHPAPISLLNEVVGRVTHANSNPMAAKICYDGEATTCITNLYSATKYELDVITNFGQVAMGFSVHQRVKSLDNT